MQKLPGFKPAPVGWERSVLRKLPGVFLAVTAVPLLFILFAPFDADRGTPFSYAVVGLIVTQWMLLLTIAIACLIVILMKGHAWVADAYALPDRDSPAPQPADQHGVRGHQAGQEHQREPRDPRGQRDERHPTKDTYQ